MARFGEPELRLKPKKSNRRCRYPYLKKGDAYQRETGCLEKLLAWGRAGELVGLTAEWQRGLEF